MHAAAKMLTELSSHNKRQRCFGLLAFINRTRVKVHSSFKMIDSKWYNHFSEFSHSRKFNLFGTEQKLRLTPLTFRIKQQEL